MDPLEIKGESSEPPEDGDHLGDHVEELESTIRGAMLAALDADRVDVILVLDDALKLSRRPREEASTEQPSEPGRRHTSTSCPARGS